MTLAEKMKDEPIYYGPNSKESLWLLFSLIKKYHSASIGCQLRVFFIKIDIKKMSVILYSQYVLSECFEVR